MKTQPRGTPATTNNKSALVRGEVASREREREEGGGGGETQNKRREDGKQKKSESERTGQEKERARKRKRSVASPRVEEEADEESLVRIERAGGRKE